MEHSALKLTTVTDDFMDQHTFTLSMKATWVPQVICKCISEKHNFVVPYKCSSKVHKCHMYLEDILFNI